jgi:hypothetical protein
VKRLSPLVAILPMIFAFVLTLQPAPAHSGREPVAVRPFQSPATAPAATRVEAAPTSPASPLTPSGSTSPAAQAGAGISPLIWIVAGLILGGVIVFFVQRASPHDS